MTYFFQNISFRPTCSLMLLSWLVLLNPSCSSRNSSKVEAFARNISSRYIKFFLLLYFHENFEKCILLTRYISFSGIYNSFNFFLSSRCFTFCPTLWSFPPKKFLTNFSCWLSLQGSKSVPSASEFKYTLDWGENPHLGPRVWV